MQVVLDTNSLIRFFTKDEPEKAAKVKYLFEKETNILIPEVVFPELEYVLIKDYGISREKLVTIFNFLVAQKNIKVSKNVKKAVVFFHETKLDMADCIIAASSLKGKLASFDDELLDVEEVKGYWKNHEA